jgi:hypothetical protein
MKLVLIFAMCILSFSANAKQTKQNVNKSSNEWTFNIKWKDSTGKLHSAQFSLDAPTVKADIQEPLHFKLKKSSQYQAQEINRWAKDLKGVRVKASVRGKKVSIQASGKGLKRVRKKLKEAKAVGEEAAEKYVEQNGYTFLKGKIVPDHIQHIEDYADDLAPLVAALGGPTKDPRTFANKALSFAQSIPYEKRGRKPDKYRRPLSMIGRNKGDCDSKTVLFLSLMHEAYPEMALGVIYIPGHAFGAIDIEPQKGDVTFRADGQQWVAVEPVGPAMNPVGKIGGKSRRRLFFRSFKILSL